MSNIVFCINHMQFFAFSSVRLSNHSSFLGHHVKSIALIIINAIGALTIKYYECHEQKNHKKLIITIR